MIKPTVGRVVWYRPGKNDYYEMAIHGSQPLAAIVAFVWSDTLVNLTVSDHDGATHKRTSVYLDQPGAGVVRALPYCEWMPYQKGQAARTDAAEAKADAAALDVSALAPRLPAGTTLAEGFTETGPAEPIGAMARVPFGAHIDNKRPKGFAGL